MGNTFRIALNGFRGADIGASFAGVPPPCKYSEKEFGAVHKNVNVNATQTITIGYCGNPENIPPNIPIQRLRTYIKLRQYLGSNLHISK
jgi:hypothetical protein